MLTRQQIDFSMGNSSVSRTMILKDQAYLHEFSLRDERLKANTSDTSSSHAQI